MRASVSAAMPIISLWPGKYGIGGPELKLNGIAVCALRARAWFFVCCRNNNKQIATSCNEFAWNHYNHTECTYSVGHSFGRWKIISFPRITAETDGIFDAMTKIGGVVNALRWTFQFDPIRLTIRRNSPHLNRSQCTQIGWNATKLSEMKWSHTLAPRSTQHWPDRTDSW